MILLKVFKELIKICLTKVEEWHGWILDWLGCSAVVYIDGASGQKEVEVSQQSSSSFLLLLMIDKLHFQNCKCALQSL